MLMRKMHEVMSTHGLTKMVCWSIHLIMSPLKVLFFKSVQNIELIICISFLMFNNTIL